MPFYTDDGMMEGVCNVCGKKLTGRGIVCDKCSDSPEWQDFLQQDADDHEQAAMEYDGYETPYETLTRRGYD